MIFPPLTVICTWTFPNRVCVTEPANVPLPVALVAVESVVPVEPVVPDVPLPEADPEVLPLEAPPDVLPVAADPPVVPAEVPMDELAVSVT